MLPHMCLQIGLCAVRLLANITWVGLGSVMEFLVSVQIGHGKELFVANITLEAVLLITGVLVLHVSFYVQTKSCWRFKVRVTPVALVWLLSGVDNNMSCEIRCTGELLIAHVTLDDLGPCVHDDLDFHPCICITLIWSNTIV